VEDVGLCNCFELAPNQGPGILHNIGGSNRMNGETIRVCRLKASGICLLRFCRPRTVCNVPNVLDDSEQYCVQNFDRSVDCGIETY
jgi:hypothetical protein